MAGAGGRPRAGRDDGGAAAAATPHRRARHTPGSQDAGRFRPCTGGVRRLAAMIARSETRYSCAMRPATVPAARRRGRGGGPRQGSGGARLGRFRPRPRPLQEHRRGVLRIPGAGCGEAGEHPGSRGPQQAAPAASSPIPPSLTAPRRARKPIPLSLGREPQTHTAESAFSTDRNRGPPLGGKRTRTSLGAPRDLRLRQWLRAGRGRDANRVRRYSNSLRNGSSSRT